MLLLLSLAILPALLIIIWVYRSDRFDREPIPLLLLSFIFGLLSTVIAVILERSYMAVFPTDADTLWVLLHSIVGIGLIEEFSKYIFLRYNLFRRRAFNEPLDGIIYAVMISMGFATLENILYVMEGGLQAALARAFTAVPAHAAFAIVMGYYVGKAKFSFGPRRRYLLLFGLGAATLLHGLYDFFLLQKFSANLMIFAFAVLAFALNLSFRAVRSHRLNSPYRFRAGDRSYREGNEEGL
jgi:protease PrsW